LREWRPLEAAAGVSVPERRGWDIGFSTIKDRCDKIIVYPKRTTKIK